MNEPVIPAEQLVKLYRVRLNSSVAVNERLQAKVAELEAANEFAKTKYSAYRDEATAEYARYELMLAEQATTIERLTEALFRIGKVSTWPLAWRIAREVLKDCGKWRDAALRKQAPR